jgi:hypothetical protein
MVQRRYCLHRITLPARSATVTTPSVRPVAVFDVTKYPITSLNRQYTQCGTFPAKTGAFPFANRGFLRNLFDLFFVTGAQRKQKSPD